MSFSFGEQGQADIPDFTDAELKHFENADRTKAFGWFVSRSLGSLWVTALSSRKPALWTHLPISGQALRITPAMSRVSYPVALRLS